MCSFQFLLSCNWDCLILFRALSQALPYFTILSFEDVHQGFVASYSYILSLLHFHLLVNLSIAFNFSILEWTVPVLSMSYMKILLFFFFKSERSRTEVMLSDLKNRSYIPTRNDVNFQENAWDYHWILCGWSGRQNAQRKDHMEHLQVVFDKIRGHQLKINPLNLGYLGQIVGFIVKHRGIEIDRSKFITSWSFVHQNIFGNIRSKKYTSHICRSSRTYMENANHFYVNGNGRGFEWDEQYHNDKRISKHSSQNLQS